jgi:hypothetical protein
VSTIPHSAHAVHPVDLAEASLDAVLLYGLTLDDDDPARGVLLGVRRELALIVSMAERTPPGSDQCLDDLAPVLEGIVRRLDVGLDLLRREPRPTSTELYPSESADIDVGLCAARSSSKLAVAPASPGQ